MPALAEFFQTNRVILYSVYGQAFFVLGLAIAFHSRKHSQLALAKRLWLLAVFGIVHGIYEWGAVFIPIQATYLPGSAISVLQLLQLILGAISFLALFQFGVELVVVRSRRLQWISMLPPTVFVLWAMVTLLAESRASVTLDHTVVLGEVLARYGLAVPGALAAAWGLSWQARYVRLMGLERIGSYFQVAAYVFVGYAFLSAITPRADFFPAAVLNYDMLIQLIGVPAPVFRAMAGIAIAYFVIRGSEIFDVETDRMLEEVAQARAVSADRERIGRELHDSIIQSLYAAGLMLEDASLAMDEDKPAAKKRIGDVIGSLNRTIRDIRRYILDLRGETNMGDWQETLSEMVRTFRLETLIDTELRVEGARRAVLTRQEGDQLLTLVREALTNITKHARATHVDVVLTYRPDELDLDIVDNGVGFTRDGQERVSAAGEHQGMRNMQERAEIIGGYVNVTSKPGEGTRVHVTIPSEQRIEG